MTAACMAVEADLERRFGGLRRLYGEAGYARLRAARVAAWETRLSPLNADFPEVPAPDLLPVLDSLELRLCRGQQRLHIAFGGQGVWNLKGEMARKLGLKPEQVRVTNPDVGGGFGIAALFSVRTLRANVPNVT